MAFLVTKETPMNLNNKFGWRDIEGWFGYAQVYDTFVRESGPNDILVEVGSWYGKSTCYLASRAKLSGKTSKIVAVDQFGEKVYRKFVENITRAGVVDLFTIIQLSPHNAIQYFHDNSVFSVFVKDSKDIPMWYAKVKPGGFIGGHGKSDIKNAVHWPSDLPTWTARKPMA